MNMNNNPTVEDLRALIYACDDSSGHHILWVDRFGEVRFALITNETPAKWVTRMEDKILFRYESYAVNNDYVGKNAASDDKHVFSLFKELLGDWEANKPT